MPFSPQSVEDAFLAYRTTRDPAALAAVYDGTSSRLLAVALHLASSANVAEDAVQDTFLFALEHPERWDESRPLVPWLLGILVNRVRQSAYRANRTPDPARLQLPEAPDPESELQANELLSQIDEAIRHLPQPYRTVVLLRLRNGLNPADIAVALDRKPSTVRAQLARGVEMLRKVLPAGVGALLVGGLSASSGLAVARQVVMQRAGQVHSALLAQHRRMLLRSWTAGLGGAAAIAALTWIITSAWSGAAAPPAADEMLTPSAMQAVAEPVVRAEPLSLPVRVAVGRSLPDPRTAHGALRVEVARPDLLMPFAAVEIEPLGMPPRAFVHYTSTSIGQWRTILPARPNPPGASRRATTDASGECRFEGLSVGHWVCRSLGEAEIVEIRPGETARLRLAVDAGCRIARGRVVDEHGTPMAGARVWVTRQHRWSNQRARTRTDAAGRFELAVAPRTTIGVSHAGYAPLARSWSAGEAGPPIDLLYQLRERGAALAGRVVDGDGNGLAGIAVEVGHLRDARVRPLARSPVVLARPQRVHTDADGRFAFDSLVPGRTRVAACGARHGERAELVELVAEASGHVQLVLQRAAQVRGCVRDPAGAPIVGASVYVGRRGSLGYHSTVTDEGGNYALTALAAGRQLVEVADYRGGFACAVLACDPGGDHEWSPTLSPHDLQLVGRVLDEDGRALRRGWVVYLAATGSRVLQLDDEGRYAIPLSDREAALPAPLQVYDRDPRNARGAIFGVPRAIVSDVCAGDGPRTVQLSKREHSVWLRGRVVLPDGSVPRGGVRVRASDGLRAWRVHVPQLGADGSFELGPLPAGRYAVHVLEGPEHCFGPFDLAARESRDLGVLTVDGSCRRQLVHVGLHFPADELSAEAVVLTVRDEAGGAVVTKYHAGSVSRAADPFLWLPTGRFTLHVESASGLVGEQRIVVDPAQPQRRAHVVALRRP